MGGRRRRHTRYWRDWSSDVCSSDLWYHTRTKKQIWLELELKPEQREAISRYMDPSDFWDCATGLIRPEDVHLYLRQMSLFQIEPRRRPPQPRQPKPPAQPPPPASEQQSLFTKQDAPPA